MARKKRKLALVMSGGGMRCVYGAGVLAALTEEFKLTEPDLVVASSGSVANGAYYLSGQYRSLIAAWLDVLPSKRFICYSGRRRILDIDYLVDEVFKKQHPLDLKTLAKKKTRMFFATTRVKDGKTIFMKMPATKHAYECLRAAKAIPLAYGKSVKLGKSEYIDGDFGSSTDDLVAKAAAEGATDIIVIENHAHKDFDQWWERIAIRLLAAGAHWMHDDGIANAAIRELIMPGTKKIPDTVKLALVAPAGKMLVGVASRKKSALRATFIEGYDDAVNNPDLHAILGSSV
jgi:predicted patatin/cPLA2 family phospholipase